MGFTEPKTPWWGKWLREKKGRRAQKGFCSTCPLTLAAPDDPQSSHPSSCLYTMGRPLPCDLPLNQYFHRRQCLQVPDCPDSMQSVAQAFGCSYSKAGLRAKSPKSCSSP